MLKTGSLLCFCFSLISSYYKLTLLNRANLFEVILGGQEGKKDIENTANKWLPKSKGYFRQRCCLHECLRMAWLKTIPTVTLLRAIWIQHSKWILVHDKCFFFLSISMPSFGIVKRPQQRHLEKYKFRYMEKVFSLSDYKSMKASWLLGLLCILLLTSRRCPSGASCRCRDAAE